MAYSFMGSVGKLAKNTGFEKLMKIAFARIEKMLLWKKYPVNVRELSIVVFELLRDFVEESTTQEGMKKSIFGTARRPVCWQRESDRKSHLPSFSDDKYIRAE